jgi:hypothetical protein
MAYRYTPTSALKSQSPVVVGASVTVPASEEFRISHAGSLNLLVGIQCASVTAGAGITAKVQSSFYGQAGADWQDGNSVSITGNGWFYIRMNVQTSGDQAKLPLADVGRIVVTTGAGSAVTVSTVEVLQGL